MAEDLKCRHGVTEIRGLNMCHQCPPLPMQAILPSACCTHIANENAALRAEVISLRSSCSSLQSEVERLDGVVDLAHNAVLNNARREAKLVEYVEHAAPCITHRWEAGEPTADGGYRQKIAGKWYQTRPVDERPKCDCGLNEILFSRPDHIPDVGEKDEQSKKDEGRAR